MSPIRLLWTSFLWPGVFLTDMKTKMFDPYAAKMAMNKTHRDRELAMMMHDIIPDVIECTPRFGLWVEFLGENTVDHGNILGATDCLTAPYVIEWPAEKDVYYTLAFVGPDYPSRENRTEYEEWNHWLVGNIHGDKWLNGDVLAKYIGPHLYKGLGFHRYVFLVYKQPKGRIKFKEPRLDEKIDHTVRANFSIREFAVKYAMGSPIAGNFFFTP